MIGKNLEQTRVDRMNQIADDLLRAMLQAKKDQTKHKEAEILLSEFMTLLGY